MQNKKNRGGIRRMDALRREGSSIHRADGTLARRPLWDAGCGTERGARYAARCARHVDADRLQLHTGGRASVRLDFRYASGRGPQHADAALAFADRFGLDGRRLDRAGRALRVTGPSEEVARYTAALPRVLEHAESLATWAARMYGAWARHSAHAGFFCALTPRERRHHALSWRAAAFRAIVAVLSGPETAPVPDPDPAEVPWEQASAVAGGLGRYGWVDIRDAYDPADAVRLLDQAVPVASAGQRPQRGAAGEQLSLFDLPSPAQTPRGPVVVIPCSGPKLDRAAPAGKLYTGTLHKHARRTADALTAHGGTVLVLSALHGLLPLDRIVEPYDHTWKDPGSITTEELRSQAAEMGLAGVDVILLTPGEYTRRAAAVWPHAHTPLAHLGIGRQRGRLTALREDAQQYTTAA
ncbi:DUF6884 domain-containing protein [Streptomyces sp. NEAU-PBA10]|uniref:DUF6884 domain-containing protein n=1 Tax=unclassified Streptomyces TaxID=2593676 RepID=UPI001EE4D452|nr:DUF6884 domain-containing protein [Streptomyces sp. T7(2022)]MCG5121563.1 hypothetical protein [Streptomyces sp. T7(2022)]